MSEVRGHTCSGLETFQKAQTFYGCRPRIDANGMVLGCDAENPIPILFCPFCGERLAADLGSVEGRLETISLAGRETFNVRDEVFGLVVRCTIGDLSLDMLKAALGRRVSVSGDVTYNRVGLPSEVSPVYAVNIIDDTEAVMFHSVAGLGMGDPDYEGRPEHYLKKAWDGD